MRGLTFTVEQLELMLAEAIDRRAGSLGMTRSDYLRDLVRKDLARV